MGHASSYDQHDSCHALRASYARHVALYPLSHDPQAEGCWMPKLTLLKKIVRKLFFSLARNNNQNIVCQYLEV